MNSLAIPVPESWRQPRQPRTEYLVADGVEVAVSVVQGLPEDPPEWLKNEITRRAAGKPVAGFNLARVRLDSGWPALVADAVIDGHKLLIVMYEFLELGAVATMTAPAALYDQHRQAVLDVLLQGNVRWGKPPVTLADLLAGSVREPAPPPQPPPASTATSDA